LSGLIKIVNRLLSVFTHWMPVVALVGVLVLLGHIPSAECREYTIATVAWAGWSPLHVADQKQIWKKLGLDVRVVDYDDPIVILEAIKAGRIDFAMDMVGSLVGVYMDGVPVTALAETNWSHGGDKILTKAGTRIEDHVGKPLGVFLNRPSCLYFLGTYLESRGLKLSDFRIVEINSRDLTAQFLAGRIPVIVNYEPWAAEAINSGNAKVLATSADFDGCIPECLWGYRSVVQSLPPQDIRNIIKGWILAVEWINNPKNWDEYKTILNERTFHGQAAYSDAELRRMFSEVRIHRPPEMFIRNKDKGGLYEYLDSLRSFLEKNQILCRDFKTEEIFDNTYVVRVLEEMLKSSEHTQSELPPN
jgi:NitT/TauT family transport system substrate-binding protein